MMEKKELNVVELDMVAGGSFWDDVGDFSEDGIKDVTNEVVEVTWEDIKMVYDAVYPIQE